MIENTLREQYGLIILLLSEPAQEKIEFRETLDNEILSCNFVKYQALAAGTASVCSLSLRVVTPRVDFLQAFEHITTRLHTCSDIVSASFEFRGTLGAHYPEEF